VKKISYDDFWQRIHTNADKKAIPLRVMFELTYDCNFRCKHCYVPRSFRSCYRSKQLKTKQVYKILEQLKDSGCLYLGFTGGEPFTRPDIFDILAYARKLGFQTIIYTNGSLLDNKAIRKLSVVSPNKIDITLPAMTEPAFEAITGIMGSHRSVFKGIEMLRRESIPLGFKSCLLKQNAPEIEEIKSFCRSLKAAHRLDALLSCRLDGSPEPYAFRGKFPTCKTGKSAGKTLNPGCSEEEGRTNDLFFCGAGRSQAAITPAGELKLCLMIPEPKYDILKLSFSKAWLKLRAAVRAIKPAKNNSCSGCDLQAYCSWCPARGWLFNKDFNSCDPQIREWAQKAKKGYES
jgi:radical SAM protein with 4Fe4S-binding SPASM domain